MKIVTYRNIAGVDVIWSWNADISYQLHSVIIIWEKNKES